MSAITLPEYNGQIREIAGLLRAYADELIAKDWAPAFAFERACDLASSPDKPTEATIQMMTYAVELLKGSAWERAPEFVAWWNKRFPDAPRIGGMAAPCIIQIGDVCASVAASWSSFKKIEPARADA